jgi:formylglycine-generating enzyme required for sulfatase activity
MKLHMFAGVGAMLLLALTVQGRDVDVSGISLGNLTATTVDITYTLSRTTPALSADQAVWIFVKYTSDGGSTWMDTDNTSQADDWCAGGQTGASTVNQFLSGDVGVVTSSGSKTITWTWGATGTNLDETDQVRVRVYAVEMCRVTADAAYSMGGDAGNNAITSGTANLASDYYLQKYPVTNRTYVDFLNEVANVHDNTADATHDYWNSTQGDATRGGISVTGSVPNAVWSAVGGREDWPVIGVNWLNAYDMTRWMGLIPTTEEQWEKGCRSVGGASGNIYSWGNAPAAAIWNCDMSGSFSPGRPCDVNTYETVWSDSSLANPFGLYEMTGNVWQWTDTEAYSGAYNAAMSGLTYASPPANVVNRAGSWGVSGTSLYGSARAITSAYSLRATYIGIRGVKN